MKISGANIFRGRDRLLRVWSTSNYDWNLEDRIYIWKTKHRIKINLGFREVRKTTCPRIMIPSCREVSISSLEPEVQDVTFAQIKKLLAVLTTETETSLIELAQCVDMSCFSLICTQFWKDWWHQQQRVKKKIKTWALKEPYNHSYINSLLAMDVFTKLQLGKYFELLPYLTGSYHYNSTQPLFRSASTKAKRSERWCPYTKGCFRDVENLLI